MVNGNQWCVTMDGNYDGWQLQRMTIVMDGDGDDDGDYDNDDVTMQFASISFAAMVCRKKKIFFFLLHVFFFPSLLELQGKCKGRCGRKVRGRS
jgi:hypothetical protein